MYADKLELEALEVTGHTGDLSVAVGNVEVAEDVAGLLIVEVSQMGAVLENLIHGLVGIVENGGAADTDPGHVLLHSADLEVFVSYGLLEGFLLLAHTEVQLAVKDHVETEGAYAGLVAVAGGIEEGACFLQISFYSFNVGHWNALLLSNNCALIIL